MVFRKWLGGLFQPRAGNNDNESAPVAAPASTATPSEPAPAWLRNEPSSFHWSRTADRRPRQRRTTVMPSDLLIVQVDGSPGSIARGVAGLGIIVRGIHGEILTSRSLRAPALTNNEAEYQAVIAGLELVSQRIPNRPICVLTDSQIVIEQLAGRSAVRAEALKPLHARARWLISRITHIRIGLIPRELNQLADALAWEALGGRRQLVDKARSAQRTEMQKQPEEHV
jgi:ribonuclease HI